MAAYEVFCALIFTTCSIAALSAQEIEEFQLTDIEPRPVGRAYSLVGCNYRFQAGYTCLSCHRALHCYPGNAAILVDCYGLFRYCRDGRCARREGERCPDNGDMSAVMMANNTLVATSPEIAAQAAAAELQASQAAQAAEAAQAAAVAQAAAIAQTAEAAQVAVVAQAAEVAQTAEAVQNAAVVEAASQVARVTIVTQATTEVLQDAEVAQASEVTQPAEVPQALLYAASATTEVLQAAEFAQATEVSRPPFDLRVAKRPEASSTNRYDKLNEVV